MGSVGVDRMLVVIVNFRTGALVVDCLRSLEAEVATCPGARVVVLDNCSGDDSCAVIAAAIQANGWGGWASLSASSVNGGFANGSNQVIRSALGEGDAPDLFWLLNPDTRVRPGAMRTLIDFMRDHPRAGILGNLIEEADGAPWPYAFRFPSIAGEVERGVRLSIVTKLLAGRTVPWRMGDKPAKVDWVSGASIVIRRKVFDDVGLMDDGFFLYFEETDFCLKAHRAGWECWYTPDARIMHIAGQSTGVTDSEAGSRRLPEYWFDSRRRYFVKNHGRAYAALADGAWIASHLIWRLSSLVRFKAASDHPHILSDFIRHSALVNGGVPGNSRLGEAAQRA